MDTKHILVIDDDAAVLSLIEEVLVQKGYGVILASTAAVGRTLLDVGTVDAVICDVYLDGFNGTALLDHPSIKRADSAVIVMSGAGDIGSVVTAMRKGAHDFLTKPFAFQDLLQSIDGALRRRQERREHAERHQSLQALVQSRTTELSAALSQLQRAYDLTIEALGAALDLRDAETERHCRNVADLSVAIAGQYGITDPDTLRDIRWGALLHDIGKIGIPDHILRKPGPLTQEERNMIELHPDLGFRILSGIDFLSGAADVVRFHHEWFDGTGYPQGLAGEEIPLTARIFSVADVVDVLINGRVYQEAVSEAEVRREIAACGGTQFDPRVVEAFMGVHVYERVYAL